MFFNSFCELIFPFIFLCFSDGVRAASAKKVHWTAREKKSAGRFTEKFRLAAWPAQASPPQESGTIQLREPRNCCESLNGSTKQCRRNPTPRGHVAKENRRRRRGEKLAHSSNYNFKNFSIKTITKPDKKLQKFLAM
jgi:hypothetical protein